MARIGLIDYGGKIPNLALMKLSSHHKAQGDSVVLNTFRSDEVDEVFCSVVFTKDKDAAMQLQEIYPNIHFGGTGFDMHVKLPAGIEGACPDYDLYTFDQLAPRIKGIRSKETHIKRVQTLLDMGIGFTTRGCIRTCKFCMVPGKEGRLHSVGEISGLINPRSNIITILDNNFTADPDCLEKLKEIKERKLIIDITQGIDVRLMTPEIAKALSEVKHLRQLHYAWDLMPFEHKVMDGIGILTQFIKTWRHLCFVLVGFDTTFEEDEYRVKELHARGVSPYIMVYNQSLDLKLRHFARYVNAHVFKTVDFEDYKPWKRDKEKYYAF
jgi:hypothetical protein